MNIFIARSNTLTELDILTFSLSLSFLCNYKKHSWIFFPFLDFIVSPTFFGKKHEKLIHYRKIKQFKIIVYLPFFFININSKKSWTISLSWWFLDKHQKIILESPTFQSVKVWRPVAKDFWGLYELSCLNLGLSECFRLQNWRLQLFFL